MNYKQKELAEIFRTFMNYAAYSKNNHKAVKMLEVYKPLFTDEEYKQIRFYLYELDPNWPDNINDKQPRLRTIGRLSSYLSEVARRLKNERN